MPTKPTNNTPIFASDAAYSVGPKVGQPTKSADLGATLAVEGHVPGKDFPTSANEFNAWLNACSQLTDWVFKGTSAKDEDAHIVETDSGGVVNALAIDVGNTNSATTSALIRNNVFGNALQIISTDAQQSAVRIDSNNTTTGAPVSLDITNNKTGFASHMIVAVTDGGSDSLGGMRIECSTDRPLNSQSASARTQSAVNAVNDDGTALEAISGGSLAALVALNIADASPSIRAGFGNEDTTPSNQGGNAIECRGGDGEPGVGIDGGDGINARGGDAVDGTFDTAGGPGIFAKGGASATEPGGPGVYCQSTGTNSVSMVVDHGNASNSADLAQFSTGDNVANGIVVTCDGFGNAAQLHGQAGAGLLIQQTPEGGGTIYPHMTLVPQTAPSIGPDVTDVGDIWVQFETSGPVQMRYQPGATRQFIHRGNQPFCALTHFQATAVGGAAPEGGAFLEIATFSFASDMRPTETGTVVLKSHGTARMSLITSETNIYDTRWVDVTAGNVVIDTKRHDANGTAADRQYDWHHIVEYTIPASGARTLKMEVANVSGDVGSEVTIDEVWIEVVALPQ